MCTKTKESKIIKTTNHYMVANKIITNRVSIDRLIDQKSLSKVGKTHLRFVKSTQHDWLATVAVAVAQDTTVDDCFEFEKESQAVVHIDLSSNSKDSKSPKLSAHSRIFVLKGK